MENQFFVDSEFLSEEALVKKHRLETEPDSRTNHMEYMPGMEKIESDVCRNVMEHMNSFDYSKYTERDVKAALEHEKCTIEDFKALLSPAAAPYLEQMAERARLETSRHFGNTVYLFTSLIFFASLWFYNCGMTYFFNKTKTHFCHSRRTIKTTFFFHL